MASKTDVSLIFDIGITSKKAILFDSDLNYLDQDKILFERVVDDDGYLCDDFVRIEQWIIDTVEGLAYSDKYELRSINFTTYGATLAYLDREGKRLLPVYNFLKPQDSKVDELVYTKWGGTSHFIRKTASPILKSQNAAFQILDLKMIKPNIYKNIVAIMHLPQYLSYLLTNKTTADITSIGCHTAMWDFDAMKYHDWLATEGIKLPAVHNLKQPIQTKIHGKNIDVGIGIHDTSATLVPFLYSSKEEFLLLSIGAWGVVMNPFNREPLTEREVLKGCLTYLSYENKPIKSSRVFLGYIHKTNVRNISKYFKVSPDIYRSLEFDKELFKSIFIKNNGRRVFFKYGVPDTYVEELVDITLFESFEHCYYQFIIDLAYLVFDAISMVQCRENRVNNLYVTGGFSHNKHFMNALAIICKDKKVYSSSIENSKALGATMVINSNHKIDLGLNLVKSIL